jgi:phytoene synthase
MIEARHAELEDRPFGDETALLAYVDGAEGGLMRAAGDVLGGFGDLDPVAAARSWGLTRLLRDGPAWAARGRTWTPETWSKAPEGAARGRLARWALDERALLRVRIRALPVHAFPALAHFALIGPYCAGRSPAGIEKRLRVVGAAVIGRI